MSTIEKDLLDRTQLEGRVQDQADEIARLKAELSTWEETYDDTPKRDALFTSVSGREVRPLYTELDVTGEGEDLGYPGEYPFTRGP